MRNREQSELALDRGECALPLRREVAAVMHAFRARPRAFKACLDIGFTHAGVSRYFRSRVGGFWATAEPTVERARHVSYGLPAGTVFAPDARGELPFEDRQFDALVLARGALPGDAAAAGPVIRECHRVLKTGGLFLMTVGARRRFGPAALLCPGRPGPGGGALYSEAELFRALKDGFDVMGFRYSCRFWVQLVSRWADRRGARGVYDDLPPGWLRLLYGAGRLLDFPLFLSRGYQMTVCARRKGWRAAGSCFLSSCTPVSDAVLFNPRWDARAFSMGAPDARGGR